MLSILLTLQRGGEVRGFRLWAINKIAPIIFLIKRNFGIFIYTYKAKTVRYLASRSHSLENILSLVFVWHANCRGKLQWKFIEVCKAYEKEKQNYEIFGTISLVCIGSGMISMPPLPTSPLFYYLVTRYRAGRQIQRRNKSNAVVKSHQHRHRRD